MIVVLVGGLLCYHTKFSKRVALRLFLNVKVDRFFPLLRPPEIAVAKPILKRTAVDHHRELVLILAESKHVIVDLVGELEVDVEQFLLRIDLSVVVEHFALARYKRSNELDGVDSAIDLESPQKAFLGSRLSPAVPLDLAATLTFVEAYCFEDHNNNYNWSDSSADDRLTSDTNRMTSDHD